MPILTELTFTIRDSLPGGVALCNNDPEQEEEIGLGELFAALVDGPMLCVDHYVERLEVMIREREEATEAARHLLRMTIREREAHS